MGVTREKNMQKFIALCALCAFASALPSGFHNDVILGRRAAKAVTTPCGCFSSACKVTAPTNGGMGDCKDTMADGSTCTPTCGSDYTKVGTTYTCTKTALTGVSCQGKPCTISSGAAVTPTGATATAGCNTLINAKSMTSGASCGFTCPANQVVDKQTTCKATVITLGSCKASYCDGVDTYAKASDAGAGGAGDCGKTLALGGTCTPATKTGYTCTGKVTCASTSVANTLAVKSENFQCTAKPTACTISSGAAVTPTGATATAGCNTLINAKSMTSGASCGFTCPANQVVDKQTTCKDTVLTLGSCKASYCDGVDTYAKASDAGAGGAGDCGKTLALGGTCTPATKTGYTCTGKVTCSSTSVANTKGTKTENFQCTAKQCTGLSA